MPPEERPGHRGLPLDRTLRPDAVLLRRELRWTAATMLVLGAAGYAVTGADGAAIGTGTGFLLQQAAYRLLVRRGCGTAGRPGRRRTRATKAHSGSPGSRCGRSRSGCARRRPTTASTSRCGTSAPTRTTTTARTSATPRPRSESGTRTRWRSGSTTSRCGATTRTGGGCAARCSATRRALLRLATGERLQE